ncbi:MAG: hypothetical protein WD066_05645 [Planctomycetaceae bacterium]
MIVPQIVIVALLLAGPDDAPASETVPAAEAVETPANHYPLHAGATWHYRVDADGRVVEVTSRVAKIERIDDLELSRIEVAVPGAPAPATTEHLRATPEGIFRQRFNGLEVEPPLRLLKYPVKEGETWKADFKAGGDAATGVCRALPAEEVAVPAGTFQTVVVLIEVDDGRTTVKTTYWFAENVGVVKQVLNIGGKMVTLELEKYESGK